MKDSIITIFTPTYNRANKLIRLYNSLINQSNISFVWLIVDDGSTDNTQKMVESWKDENIIPIKYIKQTNQGKSSAHNVGVENTDTELFTCVDSDDYLDKNAIEKIIACWKKRKDADIGILAFRQVTRFDKNKNYSEIRTSLRNSQKKHKINGDTMLIYKTEIISRYRFPYHENEKFVPEAYLYDKLDQDGMIIVLPEILYYGEYLEDGYSNNMAKLLKENPKGYMDYISQRLKYDNNIFDKYKDTIRYVAMAFASGYKNKVNCSIYPVLTVLAYPFGYYFYIKRYK